MYEAPCWGEGASEKRLRGNLFFHLEPASRRRCCPTSEAQLLACEQMSFTHWAALFQHSWTNARRKTGPPHHYRKNTVYINLAGCWITLGRGIYEVEKSCGEAKWLSNQMGGRKGLRLPGRVKWRASNRIPAPKRHPGLGYPRSQAWPRWAGPMQSRPFPSTPHEAVLNRKCSLVTAGSSERLSWGDTGDGNSARAAQVCSEPTSALNNTIPFLKSACSPGPVFSWLVSFLLGRPHGVLPPSPQLTLGGTLGSQVTPLRPPCTSVSLPRGQSRAQGHERCKRTPWKASGKTTPRRRLSEHWRQWVTPSDSPPSAPIHLPEPWHQDSFGKLHRFSEADRIWSSS